MLLYCTYSNDFERGANTLRTARGYTTISDGRLCVNKTLLPHIFSDIVAYELKLEKV